MPTNAQVLKYTHSLVHFLVLPVKQYYTV